MLKHRAPYAPEFRQQIIDSLRTEISPGIAQVWHRPSANACRTPMPRTGTGRPDSDPAPVPASLSAAEDVALSTVVTCGLWAKGSPAA